MIYNATKQPADGWQPCHLLTAGYFWGGPATRPDRLNPATIDWPQAIDAIRAKRDAPIIVDIEHGPWEMAGETREGLDLWIDTIKTVKRAHGGEVGIYRMIPIAAMAEPLRFFLGGDPDRTNYQWRIRNNRMFPLADAVDVIYPRLYQFEADWYNGPGRWEAIAEANMREALQYEKPVRPFVSPYYRGAQQYGLIPPADFEQQMQAVRIHAQDCCVFVGGNDPCPPEHQAILNRTFA